MSLEQGRVSSPEGIHMYNYCTCAVDAIKSTACMSMQNEEFHIGMRLEYLRVIGRMKTGSVKRRART